MTSKYEMAARARKKKRKVSQLGKAKGKMQSGLADASKAARQQALRKQALKKKRNSYSEALRKGMKAQAKRKLTPAEQRRRKALAAKSTTAKRKLAVQEMDKRIAKIKKEK